MFNEKSRTHVYFYKIICLFYLEITLELDTMQWEWAYILSKIEIFLHRKAREKR